MSNDRRTYLLAAFVALVTLVVYLPSLRNDFVNLDDTTNVVYNDAIRSLNWPFFEWAFKETRDYWRPAVWISHAVDYAVWGLRPAGHRLTNVLLHAASTFLVVLVVMGLLEARNRAGTRDGLGPVIERRTMLIAACITGGLFGLHPLHVESVALVASRTDVLYGLFYLLGVWFYIEYALALNTGPTGHAGSAGSARKKLRWSLIAFVLSLSAKPMAVTLPVVLLLFDWYPFGRMRSAKDLRSLVVEKSVFILCSALASILAVVGSVQFGVMDTLVTIPLGDRLLVALQSVIVYLRKMVVPIDLYPFYPYPKDISLFSPEYIVPVMLVCCITAGAFSLWLMRKQRLLLTVWGYYLISLLPVLGIIKVRPQSMGDKYTYLPSLGPFLLGGMIIAWAWSKIDPLKRNRAAVRGAVVLALVVLGSGMAYATVKQFSLWKDSITLWTRIMERAPERIPIALNARGLAYAERGQLDEALKDFDAALEQEPGFVNAHLSRAWALQETGRLEEAAAEYTKAIALDQARYLPYNDRGLVLQRMGRIAAAIEDFSAAIERNPVFAQAYANRALAYEQAGRIDLAIEDFAAALKADPGSAAAYNNRGLLYERMGRRAEALGDFSAAVRLNPSGAEAYNNRGLALEESGRLDEAVADYGRAIARAPEDYLAYGNRGVVLRKLGQLDSAVADLTKALELNPDFAEAYFERAECQRALGRADMAARDYRDACRRGIGAGCVAIR